MAGKIRVLIVDDSPLMRKILKACLESSSDFEVIATASDPFEARDLLVETKPDLMTLDLDMPKMDGLTFLEKVMSHVPTRTVILSAQAGSGSANALRALELGAIDVVEKPSFEILKDQKKLSELLLNKLKNASQAKINFNPTAIKKANQNINTVLSPKIHLIAIASSTGGTEALKVVFNQLPAEFPPILVAQHMPPHFTKTYADNLAKKYPFSVKEAVHGERVESSTVYIAPGDFHMEVKRTGSLYHIRLHQEPPLHSVRPAADYLMKSVAKFAGTQALGVVLTGMGKDGAQGLLEMKKAGAFTIAQSEKTCVVFGMPGAAISLGAAQKIEDLQNIADCLGNHFLIRKAA
jgi:two-component system chemotaxis response regulator CheB